MEGVSKHLFHRKVLSLPGILSFHRQGNVTSLPRLVMSKQLNSLNKNPCYRMDLMGHYGCVNAIEFSNKGGEFLASGSDDRRVLLWNIEEALGKKYEARSMKGEHHSNIFCLAFDNENGKVFSGGNDDQVIVHDTRRGEAVDVFLHEDAVYGLAVDPRNDNIYASACADGRVLLWDIRAPSNEEPFALANYVTAFHAVVYHPLEPRFLATANSKEGIALWDVRSPRSCLMRYGSAYTQMNAMSVRFNQRGTQLLALRRRLPAVLYNIQSSVPAVEFNHEGYYNSCTMKTCCFAGEMDEFVLSGSDDFNLYIWKVPDPKEDIQQVNEAYAILKGHRQIVNQVRFNPRTFMIASSGVEKVIKLWSAMKYPGMTDGIDTPRKMFNRQQYLNLMIGSGSALSHDYSNKSKEEDPRMLAFFDSFIQREVDHSLSSDSSDDSALSPDSLYLHFVRDGVSDGNSSDDNQNLRPSLLPPELGLMSDSESDLDNHRLNVPESSPKTAPIVQGEDLTVSTSSDAAGCSTAAVEKSTENQENELSVVATSQEKKSSSQTSNGSEGSSGARRGRQRSRSLSESSSSSDESEDFLVMRYRSRLLRRIMRQKSKKMKESSISGSFAGNEPSQVEKDKISSLHQRMAFSRVMKERFTAVSESDSSPSNENEQFPVIVAALRQRTDSARQRGRALRRHRMRALEELTSLTSGRRTRTLSPLRLPSTNSSENMNISQGTLGSTTSTSVPCRSPQRLVSNSSEDISFLTSHFKKASAAPSSLGSRSPQKKFTTDSDKNFAKQATLDTVSKKSCTSGSSNKRDNPSTVGTASQSSLMDTASSPKSMVKLHSSVAKSNSEVPSTSKSSTFNIPEEESNGDSSGNKHIQTDSQKCGSEEERETTGSKNRFKKFKVSCSGKKRHYRSTNCYSRKNDSESDE